MWSGEDVFEDVAVDVGESEVSAAVAVGEACVVESELVEDGGPEVVHGAFVFGGVVAVFVGGAVDGAAFEAAAGHEDGEAVGVVVASGAALGEGGASEFAGPDDDGFVE